MSRILDDSQVSAVCQLKPGSILCGGVGSGKSRTALAYYYNKVCGGGLEDFGAGFSEPINPIPLYIITTAMKRDKLEWEEEMVPFCLSTKEGSLIDVHVDSWNNIQKYTNVTNSFFIFDEQRLVGSGSWVKSFLKISKSNKWILLTATPGDVWMDYIPVFIANGFYRNKTEFVGKHVIYKPYRNFPIVDRYIREDILRKYRDQILVDIQYQNPTTRIPTEIKCGWNREEIRYIVKYRKNPWTKEPIWNISEFTQCLKKSIFSDPQRAEALQNLLQEHKKCIIFYTYDYELDIIRNICQMAGIVYGERNGHRHDEVPEGDQWVYIVQYTSGCEGWNCITTDTIIFYSPSNSYRQMEQAAGRIDRRNTTYQNLYYYYLNSKSYIEKRIYDTLSKKKKFTANAFRNIWE